MLQFDFPEAIATGHMLFFFFCSADPGWGRGNVADVTKY